MQFVLLLYIVMIATQKIIGRLLLAIQGRYIITQNVQYDTNSGTKYESMREVF